VVTRLGKAWVELHCADQRRLGVRRATELHLRNAQPGPRHGRCAVVLQRALVRFQRFVLATRPPKHEGQVAPGVGQRAPALNRRAESLLGVVCCTAVLAYDTEVVPGERVVRIDFQRLAVGTLRIRELTELMQGNAQLIPELRTSLLLGEQRGIHRDCFIACAFQEQHLTFRLLHEQRIFPAFGGEPEFTEGLVVERLLTEREPQVVVR
jgi:hypothetical protein